MTPDKLQHVSEEVERELAKLRNWGPRDAITPTQSATLYHDYERIEREIAEQNERIANLIATAEAALKEYSSRMFADGDYLRGVLKREGLLR